MLARHAVLLPPSIAASLPRACRGAQGTFLVPDARSRPKNPLSSFLATDPKKHLLSPSIATLPKRPEITPVFATHPRPPGGPPHFGSPQTQANGNPPRTLPLFPISYPLSFQALTHSFALFYTQAKLNSFVFNLFRTLCQ